MQESRWSQMFYFDMTHTHKHTKTSLYSVAWTLILHQQSVDLSFTGHFEKTKKE